jgi:hypothetical protein
VRAAGRRRSRPSRVPLAKSKERLVSESTRPEGAAQVSIPEGEARAPNPASRQPFTGATASRGAALTPESTRTPKPERSGA